MKNLFCFLCARFCKNAGEETKTVAISAPSVPATAKDSSLSKENLEADKIIQMQSSFASIAAHELRTPLTSIKGYLSVFLSDYDSQLNNDQKALLGHISAATEQLLSLVDNLLSVSRVERSSMAMNLQPIDWQTVVKEVVDEFKERAIEKNITLEFFPSIEKILTIKADKVRLTEVISNLLNNAIQYTNPQGRITVVVEKKEGEVVTSIADTGRGIPKVAIPNLFTKFYRVNQQGTENQTPTGTGLGLYISKAIVELHHGKIWVESEVGKGSTFRFSLPII